MSKIFCIVLIVIILLMGLIWALREQSIAVKELKSAESFQEHLEKDLKSYDEWTESYNELYKDYQKLAKELIDIKERCNFNWDTFEATAYTSKDDGVDDICASGLNIRELSKYFNLCAVDRDVIELGSILLVEIDEEIMPYLAVDTGGAIKGKKIDLYFKDDIDAAFRFGRRELKVGVLR